MDRREFGKAVAVGAAGLLLPEWVFAAGEGERSGKGGGRGGKPNIICILADDVGLPDIGCYGGEQKTPEIDALARGGTRYELCYAMPLCGPTRASLLTGRYPFRTGMVGNTPLKRFTPASEVMMPRVLKSAGYVSASVGKWEQVPLQPGDWGFEEYLRFEGSGKYWTDRRDNFYTVNGEKKELREGEYLPDIMHDYAVNFMTRHKEGPFYLYYPMSHMHEPLTRTPDSRRRENAYTANIAYMDKLVGKLVGEVERLKLREKTLIVYVGDNGTAGAGRNRLNGKEISGWKGTMWEGGSRVPLIVNWPGTTSAGKVSGDLVDVTDLYPTFAELGEAGLPGGVTIDGRSFAARVKGRAGEAREWVYVENGGACYVRTARWKLSGLGELFDMKEAPYKEIAVAEEGMDAEAAGARKHLQEILDTRLAGHPKWRKVAGGTRAEK